MEPSELVTECTALIQTQPTNIPAIMDSMQVLNENKEVVPLDDDDKLELATLVYIKSGLSNLSKKSKDMEEKVKLVGSPWMLARGVKTVKIPGSGTFSLTKGSSVTINQNTLREVLIHYLTPDQVVEIMGKVVKKSEYTTLQFKGV